MAEHALDLFAEPAPAAHEKWVAPLLGESVLGIDASLRGFAICYSVPGKPLIEDERKSEPADGVRPRLARYEQLIRPTLQVVLAHKPGLILIEGYSMGSKGGMAFDRVELGGILREKLAAITKCPIIEPAPTMLKKFTTGTGKGTKDEMVSVLARDHRRTFKTNNQADAFALCQLGLALTGQLPPPSTKPERTYLAGLRKMYQLPEVAA